MIRLPRDKIELLRICLEKHRPDLLWVIDTDKMLEINKDLQDELTEAVADEFVAAGLREDDEPNDYGLLLEDLIDRIVALA